MLVLHSVEHGKPIEKLFCSLQTLQHQDDENIAVLEMLTVLPEIIEDQNSDCRMTSAQRHEYEQEVLPFDSCNCYIYIYFIFFLSSFLFWKIKTKSYNF